MEALTGFLGLALRLGLPLSITALLVYALRRLDARWQAEARRLAPAGLAPWPPCWLLRDCPPDRRRNCPAYRNPETPCWQLFRDPRRRLPQACLECEVFRRAPALGAA